MAIRLQNVTYIYNNNLSDSKRALDNINLEIKEGKINAITGSNGSGKTTLVEIINGLIMPTEGKVIIDKLTLTNKTKNKDISSLRKKMGFVFQNSTEQFFNTTVSQEIAFGLNYSEYKDKEERIKKVLKMVGLNDNYLTMNPLKLSSGEKKMVAIASILVFNPKIIIFDEPTIGLDNKTKDRFIKLIVRLKKDYQKTIIIVSHDTNMLLKISDYLFVLDKGKLVLEGNKYEVFSQNVEVFGIETPNIIKFAKVVAEKKNIKMGYRDDINDLIKDIYRYAK